MKNNIKAYELIEKGLSAKTVSKLTESQINILHKKLISEEIKKTVTNVTYDPASSTDQQKLAQKGIHVDPSTKKITMSTTGSGEITTEEMKEDDDTDLVQQDLTQKVTGQLPADDQSDETNDGMDDDTNPKNKNLSSVGMTEAIKKNPFAICTAQLGKEFGTTKRSEWTKSQEKKYERCKTDVEKSLKEGKNPIHLFLENEIIRIVEKHIPPRITKADLMKHLQENQPAVAPPKPKKPATKPGTPTKPKSPGQNPHPGEKEAPKAVSPETAKNKVIDAIMNILNK